MFVGISYIEPLNRASGKIGAYSYTGFVFLRIQRLKHGISRIECIGTRLRAIHAERDICCFITIKKMLAETWTGCIGQPEIFSGCYFFKQYRVIAIGDKKDFVRYFV
ncbi:MAG: hypothetical protein JWM96_1222, partial [Alphaproteobacteria bacterium]|nr:hypothetical protein [Alphaproteobacteria bacterium]